MGHPMVVVRLDVGHLPEGFEASFFEGVAVEHVVGVEWNEALAVGMGDVDAGLLNAAEVEGLTELESGIFSASKMHSIMVVGSDVVPIRSQEKLGRTPELS
jgi:hypothetical protein